MGWTKASRTGPQSINSRAAVRARRQAAGADQILQRQIERACPVSMPTLSYVYYLNRSFTQFTAQRGGPPAGGFQPGGTVPGQALRGHRRASRPESRLRRCRGRASGTDARDHLPVLQGHWSRYLLRQLWRCQDISELRSTP